VAKFLSVINIVAGQYGKVSNECVLRKCNRNGTNITRIKKQRNDRDKINKGGKNIKASKSFLRGRNTRGNK
jgi:hypothetical protein